MPIGNILKELRNEKGLTQKEIADILHVTYQAVSRWENNDVEPSIDTLKELTVVLGCSLDQLLGVVPINNNDEGKVKIESVQYRDAFAHSVKSNTMDIANREHLFTDQRKSYYKASKYFTIEEDRKKDIIRI